VEDFGGKESRVLAGTLNKRKRESVRRYEEIILVRKNRMKSGNALNTLTEVVRPFRVTWGRMGDLKEMAALLKWPP
jgi:hypothetical protein